MERDIRGREFHELMSQMLPTAATITHPSQNNTSDTLKLQEHASVVDCCEPRHTSKAELVPVVECI